MSRVKADENGRLVYTQDMSGFSYSGYERLKPVPIKQAFTTVQEIRSEAIRLIDMADSIDPERRHLPDNWRRPMMRSVE